MQINWTLVSCFVIGFFAITGYSRGWWKEAVTTVFLTLLVFLLQFPNIAARFIDFINGIVAAIWNVLPTVVTTVISDILAALGLGTGDGSAAQVDPGEPGAWLLFLTLVMLGAILLGRRSFRDAPTGFGSVLGFLIGGFNGFLVLNLVREYLNGRSLPGRTPPEAAIRLAGSSSFGPAAQEVSIQATNLPSFTILDSVFPWVLIGIGFLFLFSVLKTRIHLEPHPKKVGWRRINYKVRPPFYKSPPPRKEAELRPLIKDIKKIFTEES